MTTGMLSDDAFKDALIPMIGKLRGLARMLCRDAALADDLAQEAVLRAWQRRETFTAGTNFQAWLYTILRNTFYSHRVRARREDQLDQQQAEQTLVAPDETSASLELDAVRHALADLNEEQRVVLLLAGVGEMSYEEIADICACAVGTVKSRLSRARERLEHALHDARPRGAASRPSEAMGRLYEEVESLQRLKRSA